MSFMNVSSIKAPVLKYRCELVKEPAWKYLDSCPKVQDSNFAAETLVRLTGIDKAPSEQLWVLFLDYQANVKGYYMVSSGGLTSSIADSRNVFRGAILANSHAIILGHNHPSGDPTPSQDDIAVTDRLVKAGRILGIRVLDHIVIGHDGSYTSMQESQITDFN